MQSNEILTLSEALSFIEKQNIDLVFLNLYLALCLTIYFYYQLCIILLPFAFLYLLKDNTLHD